MERWGTIYVWSGGADASLLLGTVHVSGDILFL